MNSLDFSNSQLDGNDVKIIRTALNLSQDRFSKLLDVSPISVYLWETFKRTISPRNQTKLAEIIEAMNNQKQKENKESK